MAINTIETERVLLRPFSPDDLDAFALICADPEVMCYIGDGQPLSQAQTQTRLAAIIEHRNRHGFGVWAAVDRKIGDLMGYCGLQFLDNTPEVEIGYRLARRFWGMGLASEAARASLEFGFGQLELDRIAAVVQPGNLASRRVVEKIGLKFVKEARFYNSGVRYYAITREEYQRNETT